MKQLILIDREFGAGGMTIGALLAERLKWKLFDDELSQEVARLAKIPVEVCRRHEERKDILSIFLYAPRDLKYHRILKRVGNEREALEMLDSQDDDRRKFVKHYFGHEWPQRELFHAMINTAIGDDKTVDEILHLLETLNRKA